MLRGSVAICAVLTMLPPLVAGGPVSKPVSFAILEDYDKNEDLAEIEKDFVLFDELEIKTWRGSFGWDDYEPARGQYDLAWLHRFADLAAKHRITLRPYLGYTPEWAALKRGADHDVWNNPPADMAAWSKFITALVTGMRRHRNVASYEIYNEENVPQWWDGTPVAYGGALTTAARAVYSADPRAQVIFGGLVFPDPEWIESVCGATGAAQAFDILPVHAYPETWTPADVTVENYLSGFAQFVDVADGACGHKRIWINETGFATVPGRSERDQANWWVRAIATFLAYPRVEHIGVYEIKDLPRDRPAIGDTPNYHLGLTQADRAKKLAFYTVDMMTDLLDTGTLTVSDDQARINAPAGAAGDLHYHLFTRPDGDRVLILWDRTASPPVDVALTPPPSSITEYGLDGRPESRSAAAFDSLRLIAGEPRILRIR
jgi:hypothetical protein